MPLTLTPQAKERVQKSLIEDDDSNNEYERDALSLEEQAEILLEDLNTTAEKDEVYQGFWDHFLPIVNGYWDILQSIYDYEFQQIDHNNGSFAFPDSPSSMVNESILLPTNYAGLDTSFVDPGSALYDHIQLIQSKTPNPNFNDSWHPFNFNEGFGYVNYSQSKPKKGSYFEGDFSTVKVAGSIINDPVGDPNYEWDPAAPTKFGIIVNSVQVTIDEPFTFGQPTPSDERNSKQSDLTTNFTQPLVDAISTNIQDLIDLIPETEFSDQVVNLNSLKAFIDGISAGDLLTQHSSWSSQISSLLPDIESDLAYFLDEFYFHFRKRSAAGIGFLSAIESGLNQVSQLYDEAAELRQAGEYADIFCDPLT